MKHLFFITSAAVLLTAGACATHNNPLDEYKEKQPATMLKAPQPDAKRAANYPKEQIAQGRYLVELLGCGSCHTDGALVGQPVDGRYLAGSQVGIAFSNPMATKYPGVVYPPNLTPDEETGLGAWSDEDIVRLIRSGEDRHGRYKLPVMPWPMYARLHQADAYAIAAYLRTLPPVRHQVPAAVLPGHKASAPYVHVGIYQRKQ